MVNVSTLFICRVCSIATILEQERKREQSERERERERESNVDCEPLESSGIFLVCSKHVYITINKWNKRRTVLPLTWNSLQSALCACSLPSRLCLATPSASGGAERDKHRIYKAFHLFPMGIYTQLNPSRVRLRVNVRDPVHRTSERVR